MHIVSTTSTLVIRCECGAGCGWNIINYYNNLKVYHKNFHFGFFLLLRMRIFLSTVQRMEYSCAIQYRKLNMTLFSLFPKFPEDCVVILPNGINQSVFHEIRECTVQNTRGNFTTVQYSGRKYLPMTINPTKYDSVVLFVVKLTMYVKRILCSSKVRKKSSKNCNIDSWWRST